MLLYALKAHVCNIYMYIYIKGKRATAEIDFGAIHGPPWGPGTVAWFFSRLSRWDLMCGRSPCSVF